MKRNLIPKILIVLVLVTAALAVIHLATRPEEEAGAIQIVYNHKTVSLPLSGLHLQDVSIPVVNGRGEKKTIEGRGAPLSEVLIQAGADLNTAQQVTVRAADEFYAVLTAQEAAEKDKAYLILEEGEERPRLVVTGDPDSKRQVKDAARIEVE